MAFIFGGKKKSFLESQKPAEPEIQETGTIDQNTIADNTESGKNIARTLNGIDAENSLLRVNMSEEELSKMTITRDKLVDILDGDSGVIFLQNNFKAIDEEIQLLADRWLQAVNTGSNNTATAAMEAVSAAIEKCRIDPPSGHDADEAMKKRLKFIERFKQYIELAECLDDDNRQLAENNASYKALYEEHEKLRSAIKDNLEKICELAERHDNGDVLSDEDTKLLELSDDEQKCADNMREYITLKEAVLMPNKNNSKKQMDTLRIELKHTSVDSINITNLVRKIAEGNKAWELEIARIQEGTKKLQGLNAAHKAFIDKLANDPVMLAEREKLIGNLLNKAQGVKQTDAQIKEGVAERIKRIRQQQAEAEARAQAAEERLKKYSQYQKEHIVNEY